MLTLVSLLTLKLAGNSDRLELHSNKALKELNKHNSLCFNYFTWHARRRNIKFPPSGGAGAAQRSGTGGLGGLGHLGGKEERFLMRKANPLPCLVTNEFG